MTDDETWAAAVDRDPADLLCRGAYAGWLRDRGRDAEADVWGWLNRTGRVPTAERSRDWSEGPWWDWFGPGDDSPCAKWPWAALPEELYIPADQPHGWTSAYTGRYPTASAALLAVVRYCVDNGVDPATLPDPSPPARTEPAGA